MFKTIFFFIVVELVLSISNTLPAQSVNAAVIQSYETTHSATLAPKTRPFLKGSNHNGIGKLFFGSLLFVYQNVFSAQISANCAYEISCSEYTKKCIEKHGIFVGSIQGFHQFMHCTPSAIDEVPAYMKSSFSTKIQNHVD